jgi:hypothetical protein
MSASFEALDAYFKASGGVSPLIVVRSLNFRTVSKLPGCLGINDRAISEPGGLRPPLAWEGSTSASFGRPDREFFAENLGVVANVDRETWMK